MKYAVRVLCAVLFALFALASQNTIPRWSLSKAVQTLNSSPWARQETFTRVVSGVGSGVSGEKEIFNTFYVRLLSARPVREALARIQQLQYGYDALAPEDRLRFDEGVAAAGLMEDFGDLVVVAVSFRSNDPNEESSVRRFFQKETAETLKNRAFLSTDRFSQVRILTYYPPRDEGVGAKFVFPREVGVVAIADKDSRTFTFELLEVPGANPRLRAGFAIKDMVVDGRVVY